MNFKIRYYSKEQKNKVIIKKTRLFNSIIKIDRKQCKNKKNKITD